VIVYVLKNEGSYVGRDRISFSATMFRLALKPVHPPIKWVTGSVSLGRKLLDYEVDHLFNK
jgi:hypothetical protein